MCVPVRVARRVRCARGEPGQLVAHETGTGSKMATVALQLVGDVITCTAFIFSLSFTLVCHGAVCADSRNPFAQLSTRPLRCPLHSAHLYYAYSHFERLLN